ncbi:MAG: VOC family protein [Gemmatimonadetes bacterium]|nr:MAG: VOC family protein [Gemmatimonadota bacterium]
MSTTPTQSPHFHIVGVNYISIYVKDYEAALAFYSHVLGKPAFQEKTTRGWSLGNTWLTLFPAKAGTNPTGNPQNMEFAIQVATPDEVDRLHQAFLDAGATDTWTPEDTWMYENMRFGAIDDPFGVRIDIYCPLK